MSCPRCSGFLYVDLDDVRCLSCAYRPPLPPIPPVYRDEGGTCVCGRPSVQQWGVCRPCRYADHGAKVARGMAEQREEAQR